MAGRWGVLAIVLGLGGRAWAACDTATCDKGKYCDPGYSACQPCDVRQGLERRARASVNPSFPAAATMMSSSVAARSSVFARLRCDAGRASLRCVFYVRLTSLSPPPSRSPPCHFPLHSLLSTPQRGTFSSTATNSSTFTACFSCSPGKYQDSWAQSGCSECESGKYSAINASIVKSDCKSCSDAGKGAMNGGVDASSAASECRTCPVGKVSKLNCDDAYGAPCLGPGRCSLCVAERGEYQDNPGETTCKTCSAGQKRVKCAASDDQGQSASLLCTTCGPGTFMPPTPKGCAIMDKQTIKGYGCTKPSSSKPWSGGSSPVFAKRCTLELTTIVNATDCYSCPKGTYQPASGSTECIDCPVRAASSAPYARFATLVRTPPCAPTSFPSHLHAAPSHSHALTSHLFTSC